MTNELVKVDNYFIAPATSVGDALQRYQDMKDFIAKALRRGVDFGEVPGIAKPTLLKAGAEKLGTLFGLSPVFIITERTEDWTGADHNGEPFFYYRYKCELYRGERKVGDGEGSCNSFEKKYRYRWVNEADVPDNFDKTRLSKRESTAFEFSFAVNKGETSGKYGKPAEYWQGFRDAIENGTAVPVKKATSSGKMLDGYEIPNVLYRIPNEDVADQVNTIQKMAQKRAFVAAILIATNASDYFTQDMEDFTDHKYVEGEFEDASYTPIEKEEQKVTVTPDKWGVKELNDAAKFAACDVPAIIKATEASKVLQPGVHNAFLVDWIKLYKGQRDLSVPKQASVDYADEKILDAITIAKHKAEFPDADISVEE